jgi:hypothetical protein
MRVVMKDGSVFRVAPATNMSFSKEGGHSSRFTIQGKDGSIVTLKCRDIQVIDHKRGGSNVK